MPQFFLLPLGCLLSQLFLSQLLWPEHSSTLLAGAPGTNVLRWVWEPGPCGVFLKWVRWKQAPESSSQRVGTQPSSSPSANPTQRTLGWSHTSLALPENQCSFRLFGVQISASHLSPFQHLQEGFLIEESGVSSEYC